MQRILTKVTVLYYVFDLQHLMNVITWYARIEPIFPYAFTLVDELGAYVYKSL